MSLFDQVTENLAALVADKMSDAAQQRVSALLCVRTVMPDADVYDRIRLANYILTGSDEIETEGDQVEIETFDGEKIRLEKRTQTEDYPFESGDVLVLGPEIFANTPGGPDEDTVINWRGVNFAPQNEVTAAVLPPGAMTGVVGPDPAFDQAREPAPSAGTRWAGRRGPD
jgi:hypothetical protein